MRSLLLLTLLALCFATGCAPEADTPADGVEPTVETPSETLDRLQGDWRSTEDANVLVTFDGDRFTEGYDGEMLVDESVEILTACDGNPDPNGMAFRLDEEFCYELIDVTADTLVYTLVGGRGNLLTFTRAADLAQGEPRADDALFGEAVCEALRPAVLTGRTDGLDRYATDDVLHALAADARQGFPPDEEDVRAWSDADGTCSISMPGDVWFELTLMGDGHVGQNAVSIETRTSYDGAE